MLGRAWGRATRTAWHLFHFHMRLYVKVAHGGGAASENVKYAGAIDVMRASLYSLCWSSREHLVQI